MNYSPSNQRWVILGIFTIVLLIYLMRLFYIQVIEESYKASAENNVLRYVTEYPARGLIYDRKGKLIVYNEAVYDLMVTPKQVKNLDTVEFCTLLGITKVDFIRKMIKARQFSPVKSSIFEKQISAENYATFQEKLYKFNGFYVLPRTLRKYPSKVAAHALGYIGEADERTIAKDASYQMGDYIGISGIEQSYEKELRGKRGLRVMMVDVFNREKGSFQDGKFDSAAVAGLNLTSTLDDGLQDYAEKLLQNKAGTIVAIEPETGEILAMASCPSYDPNLLVGRVRSKNYGMLLSQPNNILFNRALQSYYPPGSTFKPVEALIGQQEGVLFNHTSFYCPGAFILGGLRVKCDATHGSISLLPAIQHSCNTYFCHTFRAITDQRKFKNFNEAFENWRKHVLSFGIGIKLDIDLPHVLSGNVPTIKYYDKYFGAGRWKSSTIISLSIGQGELGVNPLQLANISATIANRGYYYTPHIIKYIGDNKMQYKKYITKNYTTVDSKYFEIVVEGMANVVEAGTAAASRLKNIIICGKTGTAQNPNGPDNSLFIAFAPKENPKIAIAVVIEKGGWGARWAAPMASLLIEKYLTDSISRPDVEKRMFEGNLLSLYETDWKKDSIAKKQIAKKDSLMNTQKIKKDSAGAILNLKP
ncbi:MAG TPA: penicillin-binding protein 2 [Bacteroidia bacterium]|nr:penicillin-binding protein 2 [Bacteroidia bacterium]